MNKTDILSLSKKIVNFNPVIKKEMRIAVRSSRFVATIIAYNGVLMALALLAYYASFGRIDDVYREVNYQNIIVLNVVISFIQLGLILFSVPSFTAGTIAGEREKQTLDILLTTSLKPMQIITGKLFASISSILLLYIASIPILGITFAIGGIDWKSLVYLTIVILCCSLFLGSIGMYFSAKMKKSVPATVMSYAMAAFLVGGTYVVIFIWYFINYVMFKSDRPGAVVYILLINPLMTVISLFSNQFGVGNQFMSALSEAGAKNTFILENWFWVSLATQVLLAVLLIFRAAHNLDPLRSKRRGRRKNK